MSVASERSVAFKLQSDIERVGLRQYDTVG